MSADSPFRSAAATDTGLLREHNEDRYFIDPARGVFLVVDGVGGHAAGELAAQTAVEAIRETFAATTLAAEKRVRTAIAAANNRIFHLAARDDSRKGMACVLTLALVEDGQITVGHVGDSRMYLIWNGAIRKLTSDHSPVGQDEDAGELTEEQAMRHPRRNEVYRDVGTRPRKAEDADFIEIRKCRFHRDAAILLCSDGLTDHLSSGRVREIVERYDGDAESVANELVEAANGAGGRDNITALFVAGPEFRGRSGITRPRASTTRFRPSRGALTGRAAFLVYGLLLAMVVWAVLHMVGRIPGSAQLPLNPPLVKPRAGLALRASKSSENPHSLPEFSMNFGKAGRGASRGPGGPPYFGVAWLPQVRTGAILRTGRELDS